MRLISVVICGLFYSALANDDKQPKSILLFIFLMLLLFIYWSYCFFLDIGIFNVVRFPNSACVGSNANVSISFRDPFFHLENVIELQLVISPLTAMFWYGCTDKNIFNNSYYRQSPHFVISQFVIPAISWCPFSEN